MIRRLGTALVCLAGWAMACAPGPPPGGQGAGRPAEGSDYRHNRTDYERFRERHPQVIEPNYLPFMAWTAPSEDGGNVQLIFCRWPDAAFPLEVHLAEPVIGESLQDEFHPTPPAAFVEAAARALATWESELEGLVSFRLVGRPEDATLLLRLIPEEAPVPGPGVKVLGTTPLADACRIDPEPGWGAALRRSWARFRGRAAPELGVDPLPVRFHVPELWIYIADEFGLLNPDQVERIALHEIGHALGMRGHSPVPNDLMFETVREVPGAARLSIEDVNSFVSLYALPNGTPYLRLPAQGVPEPERLAPPAGPPRLALAPHVDPRRGFEIQLPQGWMKVETPTGLVAIDGVTWDYAASFQVIVRRFPSVDAYLERHASAHVRDGRVLDQGFVEVGGHLAFHLVVESAEGDLVDDTTLIESGDGRVFVAIGDCRPEACAVYRPWFHASLESLEIWREGAEERRDREYRAGP